MNVLVTGATGKAGRQMVEQLAAAGMAVRAGSRHLGPASPGVTPVIFDWYDKTTWALALGEADGLVVKGLDLDHYAHETVAQLIASAPLVRHVVFLSATGVEHLPDDHPRRALELVVENSGRQWTILRANWFMQNFDEDERVFAEALRSRGELHAPTGQAKVSFVDTRDLAAATAAALTRRQPGGHAYTITGPDSVTFGEVAEAIGRTTGRTIRHVDETFAEHREHMRGPGIPADYANHINELFKVARTGVQAPVSGDYQMLTGNPPRTLHAYMKEAWTPAPAMASTG
ncbi:MAG: hypothetical protein JWR32_4300 [Mycobacterium sp.]|jgi:uncharacterized protein YbjT (DUF2867 family)|nr:hypothetical protein [Mycobacterium sp.]